MIITDLKYLRKPCKEVSFFEAELIIKKLEDELDISKVKGVGLSANQIGIDARVCIIRTNKISLNLINPFIVEKYDLIEFNSEGCLSLPNQFILTKRFNEILVKDSLHISGIISTGFEAVVIQHELCHLNGELMFQYKITRPYANEICWCGSNRKYKTCHMGKAIKS